ncbi:DUF2256 domain-containing protein [Robiginitomaculum antarcticum]|uniref:DUF2256 domain-containing protein n=1 Tax=Robiginitomaculum antarcticum TaxID=437507 RepID=UPI000A05B80E|nr:DUF2256 domain-containing protein [Robiginitomaculum antarcticum]
MPRHQKAHLPEKDCLVCGRPFAWRKKWERDWGNVKFCSARCRRESKRKMPA